MNKCLLCSTKTDGRPAFYADRDWYVGMFENEMDISYYPKGSDEIVPITFPINYCPNCGRELEVSND